MASGDALPVPRKNTAYRFTFAIRKPSDSTLITSWTGQDSEVSLDGGSFADCTNEATEIGTSGVGYIDLTSAEMNADCVVLKVTVTNSGAVPLVFVLYPEEAGDYRANVTHFGGTAGTFSSGRPEVNATHWAGTAVGSVTISCNVTQISGDTTAADNAESFFDGTGYAGTNNVIPTVTTLTNKTGFSLLATTGLGNQTADITGSLSGSVGSVTGAVGSVTGNVGGNVTGSVGSVVGNVGGSVASVASGGITSTSFAADSITASALAESAVTEIQSGLSTLTPSQVNAEVLDVLQTDTFAELSAPPAATSSIKDKLTWVFQWLRNKSTQTSTQRKLYADDGSTVVSTETVSDDGTTYTKGEQA
jgi:hypothetical protein